MLKIGTSSMLTKERPTALMTKTMTVKPSTEMRSACHGRRRQPEHVCTAWYTSLSESAGCACRR
jgi:hypothetical protein